MPFDISNKRIWVAGHDGMVGSALVRRLRQENCTLLFGTGRATLDLRRQADVEDWMRAHRPQVIIVAAGRVGGVHANSNYPVDFLYDNIMIAANVIHSAHRTGVE